jgi:hypothetical protein
MRSVRSPKRKAPRGAGLWAPDNSTERVSRSCSGGDGGIGSGITLLRKVSLHRFSRICDSLEVEPEGSRSTLASSRHDKGADGPFVMSGGDGGIRTLDALLAHTPLAGEHLRPLGHVSRPFRHSPNRLCVNLAILAQRPCAARVRQVPCTCHRSPRKS